MSDFSSAQFAALTAPPAEPGADPRFNATGRRLIVPTLNDAPGSIPKPRGSAGGGRRGYHLQAAMGLTGPDSDKLYNMILVCLDTRYTHPICIDPLCRPLSVNLFMRHVSTSRSRIVQSEPKTSAAFLPQ